MTFALLFLLASILCQAWEPPLPVVVLLLVLAVPVLLRGLLGGAANDMRMSRERHEALMVQRRDFAARKDRLYALWQTGLVKHESAPGPSGEGSAGANERV